jgi:hypothetical protein
MALYAIPGPVSALTEAQRWIHGMPNSAREPDARLRSVSDGGGQNHLAFPYGERAEEPHPTQWVDPA